MTLDDFFSSMEMKDGLMAPARVEELISIMKKGKLSVGKNIIEAARRWSIVASTLAATENNNFLDPCIRLDGLYLLDEWLQEVDNYSYDPTDITVVDAINTLLGALKKMPVDSERSNTSGIRTTVENLLGHKSFGVQDRARTLIDSSNHQEDNNADQHGVVKEECDQEEVKKAAATSAMDSGFRGYSAVEGSTDEDSHAVKPVGGVLQQSRSSEGSPSESLKDVQVPGSRNVDASVTTLNSKDEEGDQGDPQTSTVMSTPCRRTLSTITESSVDSGGEMSTVTCHSLNPKENNVEDKSSDVPEAKGFSTVAKETDTLICSPEKVNEKKMLSVSSTSVPEAHSSSCDPANALQSVTHSAVLSHVDAKESEVSTGKNTLAFVDKKDLSTLTFKPRSEVVDCGATKHLSSEVEIETAAQGGGCNSNALQDLSINCCVLGKPGDRKKIISRKEGTGAVNHGLELTGESILKGREKDDVASTNDVSKSVDSTKLSAVVDKSRLALDFDFSMDDAPEIATQVAKAVEREVVDYREPFCRSSSEKISEGGLLQRSSPGSTNGEQLQSVVGPLNKMQLLKNQDLSQVNTAAQEPEGNPEKSKCDFDLNADVSSEELDHQRNLNPSPVKFVSASKAATSELAAESPRHFEEEQGWKTSAATNDFCPASSCRTLDGEKAHSVEEYSDSLKQRQGLRDIDLNVIEGDDSGVIELVVDKQIPVSSGLPSGESDRIKLDLNRTGDNEDVPSSYWRTEEQFPYHHSDVLHSPSLASSRQPSMRDIDLNDNPYLRTYDQRVNDGKSFSQEMNACGGLELDNPVISIMGTRVVVNREVLVPESWSFLPNGQVGSSPIDVSVTGSGGAVGAWPEMAYAQSSPLMFGHNGLTMGSSVSVTSAMYEPSSVPNIVDPVGAPVASELMGSMTAVPSSYFQPFLMSMASPPSSPNGVSPRKPRLDLNSGLTGAEGESSESGGLRQLLVLGQGAVMEEQMRSNLQLLSTGPGLKRSEPDAGSDVSPINLKRQR